MSSTASNYDIPKLIIGLSITLLATLLAFITSFPSLAGSLKTSLPLIGIILLYGVMMFASSYVEEEHHFWYWAATAWLVLLSIKGCVCSLHSDSMLTII
jgi:ethanolaminephosphotransferase